MQWLKLQQGKVYMLLPLPWLQRGLATLVTVTMVSECMHVCIPVANMTTANTTVDDAYTHTGVP